MTSSMEPCCEHRDADHSVVSVCQDVIHYPSEDYPCLCPGYVPATDGSCSHCGHKAASHAEARVCRPPGGAFCACRQNIT